MSEPELEPMVHPSPPLDFAEASLRSRSLQSSGWPPRKPDQVQLVTRTKIAIVAPQHTPTTSILFQFHTDIMIPLHHITPFYTKNHSGASKHKFQFIITFTRFYNRTSPVFFSVFYSAYHTALFGMLGTTTAATSPFHSAPAPPRQLAKPALLPGPQPALGRPTAKR